MNKRLILCGFLGCFLAACTPPGSQQEQAIDAAKLEQIRRILTEEQTREGQTGQPPETGNPYVDGQTFVRLKVSPATLKLVEGTSLDFRVIAERKNTREVSLGDDVQFEWDDSSLAEIDDIANSARFDLHAIKPGKTRLIVRYQDLETEVQLEVSEKSLLSIDVTPKTILLGTATRFLLTATYDNGTQEPVVDAVQWETSDSSGIGFAGSVQDPSIFLGKKVGLYGIRAQYRGSTIVSRTRVEMPQLASISIAGNGSTFLIGTTTQLQATGTFLNGESFDITSSVQWASEDTQVVRVSSQGIMETVTPGEFSVTASFGAVSGEGSFFVTNVNFVSYVATPSTLTVPVGAESSVRLFGVLAGGAQQDITDFAQWQVLDQALAQNGGLQDPAVKGKVAALQKGATTLRARYGQTQIDIPLTVTDAALREFTISSTNPDGPCGVHKPQFRAEGTFSDGTKQDVTALVTWSVAPATHGVASQEATTRGLITTTAPGNAEVVASFVDVFGVQLEERAPIKIGPAQQTGVGIQVPSPSLALGETMSLTAGTIMSCGPGQDWTKDVTWTSMDTSRIEISNASASKGFLTTKGTVTSPTTITVRAEKSGFVATAPIELRPKEVKQLTVKPAKTQIVVNGETNTMALEASFTDNTVADITDLTAYPGHSVVFGLVNCSLPPCASIHTGTGVLTAGATEGLVQPFATLTLPSGRTVTSSRASVRVVSKCTSGVRAGFYCTFRGTNGASCQQVCSQGGGTYHDATSFFFGHGGDPNECSLALRAHGYSPGLENLTFSYAQKVGCAIWTITALGITQSVRETAPATAAAADPNIARICACREP